MRRSCKTGCLYCEEVICFNIDNQKSGSIRCKCCLRHCEFRYVAENNVKGGGAIGCVPQKSLLGPVLFFIYVLPILDFRAELNCIIFMPMMVI